MIVILSEAKDLFLGYTHPNRAQKPAFLFPLWLFSRTGHKNGPFCSRLWLLFSGRRNGYASEYPLGGITCAFPVISPPKAQDTCPGGSSARPPLRLLTGFRGNSQARSEPPSSSAQRLICSSRRRFIPDAVPAKRTSFCCQPSPRTG